MYPQFLYASRVTHLYNVFAMPNVPFPNVISHAASGNGKVAAKDRSRRPLMSHMPVAATLETPQLSARISGLDSHDALKGIVAIPARRSGALGAMRELVDCYRTNRIIRNTTQRVMLLHAEAPAEDYRRILVPVDLAGPSAEAVRDVLLMLSLKAQIVFLQSFKLPDEMILDEGVPVQAIQTRKARARENAMLKLDRFVGSLDLGTHLVSRVTHHGEVLPLIVSYASRMNADLIVVGRPERFHATEILSASSAWQLCKQAGCDVLIAARTHSNPPGT